MNIKEIAEIAGVSKMTVSNVINHKYTKVSKDTIKKVTKVIEKNNYIPNQSARILSASNSKIIALIVPHMQANEADNFFSDPYTSQMVGVIETQLRAKGYFAMIRSVSSINEALIFINSWKIDGAIFILTNNIMKVESLKEKIHIPIIFMDAYSDNKNLLSINIDDYKGGYLSTKYLINKGHKNIAFVSPDFKKSKVISNRYKGYCQALSDGKIEFNKEYLIESKVSYEGGNNSAICLSKNKNLTAAITTADIIALGIIDKMRELNICVPTDFSVIGFDNLTTSKYGHPKITTIDQHIDLKGMKAIELLFDKIDKKNIMSNNICIDVDLIERQSVKKLD
jgi:LacI family transcriptional regulator